MPSFNGLMIFGAQVSMTPGNAQRQTQQNTYMGLNGTEELDGGYRVRFTSASGRLYGLGSAGGLADFIASCAQFDALMNGRAYVLIDTAGRTFNNVRMDSFNLDSEGGIRHTTLGDYFQLYTATFVHLSRT